jgi:hypothetical protein
VCSHPYPSNVSKLVPFEQNKELLFASRAYPSSRSVLGDDGGGDKKAKKKGQGRAEPAERSTAVAVTTAFIFTMSAAANCEVGGDALGAGPRPSSSTPRRSLIPIITIIYVNYAASTPGREQRGRRHRPGAQHLRHVGARGGAGRRPHLPRPGQPRGVRC